jgi:filamentous hemagglutinin family protein
MSDIAYIHKTFHAARKLLQMLLGMTFLAPSFAAPFALAQVSTAITQSTGVGDLGTTVRADGNTVQITGGTRPGDGANLFHSFDQFIIGHGDTAQFLNTTPSISTSNILSRVTGNNPSAIYGIIDTMSYPGANLFLMNPAGIVFGPDATLNVGGSVAFTTADYLRLAEANGSNAGIFHADTTATSLLTSTPVAAFGFLGSNPAALAVQGPTLDLRQPDQSISLVGGNQGFHSVDVSVPNGVTITNGHLSASSGRINIASVASPGEILTGTLGQAQNIKGQSFGSLGAIHLSESGIGTNGVGGGTILIRGGHLVIGASRLSATTGDITLDATSIRITSAQIATVTQTNANAGHIILKSSGDVSLGPGAVIVSSSIGSSGHAGNITLSSAHGNLGLADSGITSQTDNRGNTGHIKIDIPHGDITLDNAHVFNSAQGTGTLREIQIRANNLLLQNEASIVGNNFTTQVAENIAILLEGRLDLTGNAVIETGTLGSTKAADLTIRSHDVLIAEKSKLVTSTSSSGDAGGLSLFTDNLQLTDGGRLLSGSLINPVIEEIPSGRGGFVGIEGLKNPGTSVLIDGPESGIFTNTEGTGAGGNVNLTANSVTLQNGGKISAESIGTSSTATGGSIMIRATDQVTLTNSASITASTSGPGDAGNVTIRSDQLIIASGGRIEASTSGTGTGGSIGITTTGDVTVTGLSTNGQVRSGIFAKTLSAGGGSGAGGSGKGTGGNGAAAKPGKAGDITIKAKNLLMNEGAQIDSSTTSGGAGGTVSIKTAENITIAGSSTRLTSDATRGNGKGGSLTLVAKNITVRDNASVTAATGGKGDAGNISLAALDQLLLQSTGTVTTSTSGSGKGGTIVIQANQVLLDGQGTRISADTLPPFADMIITIKILHPNVGDLVVQLESPTGTRVALLSRVGGSGANFIGTQLTDRAPTQITSGSAPFTGTFTPREPLSQLNNELVAGNWALNVRDQTTGNQGSLESWTLQIGEQTFQSTGEPIRILDNDGVRSTITVANPTVPTVPGVGEAPGIGGSIVLTAGQSVTVSNGASVSASSTGPGNAGNISIDAGQQFDLLNKSLVTTEAKLASGGNIKIKAVDLIRIANSKISSSVQGDASTAGGNITIDPNTVILQNAQIRANAIQGSGGNITITTPTFLADQFSLVDASSQFGLNGRVTIQSPTSNLSGTVTQLASKPTATPALLQNRCVALAGGGQSSFIVAGRDALPAEPGGWLGSPIAMPNGNGNKHEDVTRLITKNLRQNESLTSASHITETGVLSLRRLTPPGFLVRTFANGATGCHS